MNRADRQTLRLRAAKKRAMAAKPRRPTQVAELAGLRAQLAEAQQTIDAIRSRAVDALVVNGPNGQQLVTLEAAERSYRVLVEAMTEGAATLAADGTILYCNVRFAQMLGMSLRRVIGASLRKYVESGHRPAFDALLSVGRKRDSKGEITLTASGDKAVPIYLSVNAMSAENSQHGLVLCLVATDLSDQKRNEEMLASERLARSVLEQATEAIVVCDMRQRIVRASEATHRLCGGNPLLQSFDEVFRLEVDHKPVADVAVGTAVIEGLAVRFLRADGQAFDLLLSAGPLLGEKKKVLGRIVTLTDVTRLKNVEADLQSAITARDEFLAIASHELRTPLTTLLLQVQSLQEIVQPRGDAEVSRKLQVAERQTGQLNKLVDGLLDASRITTGRMKQVREKVDLAALARQVIDRCRPEALRAGCTLELKNGSRVMGSWDPAQLEQVLANLIGNAIKYGPSKPIHVTVEGTAGVARIRVHDHGIGIAAIDSKRIFECFERAVSPIHYGGLGLGLFVASRIVHAHGGTITVLSTKSKGSMFTVTLPKGAA